MGGSISLNQKPSGRCILNKTYETKESTSLSFWGREIAISEGYSKPAVGNPPVGAFRVEIPPGLRFIVIDAQRTWGFDSGISLGVQVQINNNIELTEDDKMWESFGNSRQSCGEWKEISCLSCVNKTFLELRRGNTLWLNGAWVALNSFKFFNYAPGLPEDGIIRHNPELLYEVV